MRLTSFLVIVLIVAWLVWTSMRRGGFSLLGDLVAGVVGDFLFN